MYMAASVDSFAAALPVSEAVRLYNEESQDENLRSTGRQAYTSSSLTGDHRDTAVGLPAQSTMVLLLRNDKQPSHAK